MVVVQLLRRLILFMTKGPWIYQVGLANLLKKNSSISSKSILSNKDGTINQGDKYNVVDGATSYWAEQVTTLIEQDVVKIAAL